VEIRYSLRLPRDEVTVPLVRTICRDAMHRLGVTDDCQGDAATQHQLQQLGLGRAERGTDPDLLRALCHRIGDHAVDPQRREQQ